MPTIIDDRKPGIAFRNLEAPWPCWFMSMGDGGILFMKSQDCLPYARSMLNGNKVTFEPYEMVLPVEVAIHIIS